MEILHSTDIMKAIYEDATTLPATDMIQLIFYARYCYRYLLLVPCVLIVIILDIFTYISIYYPYCSQAMYKTTATNSN